MGQATVYCENCGEMIPEQDFAKGKAVHHDGKNYCQKCREQVAELQTNESGTPGTPGSGVHKPGSGVFKSTGSPYPSVRRVSGVFQPAAVGKATASGVQKRSSSGIRRAISAQVLKPVTPSQGQKVVSGDDSVRPDTTRARRKPTEETGSNKKMIGIVAAIVGAIVIVVVIVMAVQASAEKKKAEEHIRRHGLGATALDEVRIKVNDLNKKPAVEASDFEEALGMLNDKRELIAKADDSELSSELSSLEARVQKGKKAYLAEKEKEDTVSRIEAEGLKDLTAYEKYVMQLAQVLKAANDAPPVLGEKIKAATANLRQSGVRALLIRTNKQLQEKDQKPPLEKMLVQLKQLKEACEDMPDLAKEVQVEIDQIGKMQDDEVELLIHKLQADVDLLCGVKKFDEAISQIEAVGREVEKIQKAYAAVMALRRDTIERKKRESSGSSHIENPVGPGSRDKEIVLFSGTDLSGWQQQQTSNGSWTVDPAEKSLKGVNNQTGAPSNEKALWIFKSEPSLEDFDLSFEVRNVRGGGFTVGARIGTSGGNFIGFQVPGGSQWVLLVIEYRGNKATFHVSGRSNDVDFKDQRSSGKGMVGFGLASDQSAEFRNITVTPR